MRYKKAITIVLALSIYFTLLTLISLTKASEYAATGENLVSCEGFSIWAGEGMAWADHTGLHFRDEQGSEKAFAALIPLNHLQQLQVCFNAFCPEELAGTAILHVDLYADGYDADEQEFVIELKAGQNEVTQVIDKGGSAPNEAYFRVFCLDAVQCDITDLNVQSLEEVPHSFEKISCTVLAVLLTAILIMVAAVGRKNREEDLKEIVNHPEPMQIKTRVANQDNYQKIFSEGGSKAFILIFLGVLYLPMILSFISKTSQYSCDVPLAGYGDITVEPKFTIDSFFNGGFQGNYSAWYESNLKPRGVLTKTYATIQYNCFNLGNRVIGYNKDIFEAPYINSKLCINGYADFSKPENRKAMEGYIEKLELLQKKLAKFDKYLYVYIAPSKADFHFENIPQKYKDISESGAVSAMEAFSDLIEQSDIPHLICTKEQYDSRYPAFYRSGIHWSRTYEQQTSVQIIDELSKITGKNYRNIILGNVQKSHVPFWRDADVYDLLNVWNPLNGTYYEYIAEREDVESYDKIRVLMQGSSFSMGVRKSILDTYPHADVIYINRNTYFEDRIGNIVPIESWETFDVSAFLDCSDVVMIETIEHEIAYYSHGFVDYLIDFLDNYEPGNGGRRYVETVDCNFNDAWQSDSLNGVYGNESGFVWASDYCEFILENPQIADTGLELELCVPPYVFATNGDPDVVDVYVNGKKMLSQSFNEEWEGSLYIPPQRLSEAVEGSRCDIEVYCSKYFIPSQLGMNDDNRSLAIQIKYVGSAR